MSIKAMPVVNFSLHVGVIDNRSCRKVEVGVLKSKIFVGRPQE